MKKILMPLILALLGIGAGAGAGHFLKPEPEPEEVAEDGHGTGEETAEGHGESHGESHADSHAPATHDEKEEGVAYEYVKLDRQFVVPVVSGDRVTSMIVISVALEVKTGETDSVLSHEPKIRDEFLKVMFLHAQSGGFAGSFTEPHVMDDLRNALKASARSVLGPGVHSVLMTNLVRQDV